MIDQPVDIFKSFIGIVFFLIFFIDFDTCGCGKSRRMFECLTLLGWLTALHTCAPSIGLEEPSGKRNNRRNEQKVGLPENPAHRRPILLMIHRSSCPMSQKLHQCHTAELDVPKFYVNFLFLGFLDLGRLVVGVA